MGDQAETLRKLMQQRMEESPSAGDGSVPVITLSECGRRGSTTTLQAELCGDFRQAGIRALAVDYGGGEAECSQSLRVPVSSTLTAEDRDRLIERLEREIEEVDVILVTSYVDLECLPLPVYGPAAGNVIVLTEEEDAVRDAMALIRQLRQRAGVTRLGVIVKEVTDGARGLEIFRRLQEVESRFLDAELEYLGHYASEKNISRTVRKPDFLINLNSEVRAMPSVELLGKRLRSKYLENAGEVTGSPVQLISGRFREEPARGAPGNLARFWRTLLAR